MLSEIRAAANFVYDIGAAWNFVPFSRAVRAVRGCESRCGDKRYLIIQAIIPGLHCLTL